MTNNDIQKLIDICEVQLNSESGRFDEFKKEPAQRTRVREHRRTSKNSLVSSFLNLAVLRELDFISRGEHAQLILNK